ncbi:hypothetical protein C8R46DRAFT_1228677 [Mycena filopes]|nr:hypothetical protein C8R46DRAFT_1228677 [Mycena filopes]
MRSSKLPAGLLLATAAGRMVVHERRSNPPSAFVSLGPAPSTEMLTLRVALTSNNVAGLEQKLTSLATPGSAEFRQWLSMEEEVGSKFKSIFNALHLQVGCLSEPIARSKIHELRDLLIE